MPLQSIRVLDLSRLLPGPYCTQMLADFGAEVVKVEAPGLGDYARHIGEDVNGDSIFFHQVNQNKKSICLNLKDTEDKQQFIELVKVADVIVESFRPGVMKRLGLDYDYLKIIQPKLIYCAITGYGQTGPYAKHAGHDLNYISETGLLHLSGQANATPTIPATQIADIAGGAMPATIGILLALLDRQKTGQGQFVDIAMADGALNMLPILFSEFLSSEHALTPGEQPLTGGMANYFVYQTKDERYLSVGAVEMKFWKTFCETIGHPELIEELNAPQAIQKEMKMTIQKTIKSKTLQDWLDIFDGKEACVSAVLDLEEVIQHPQFQARAMFSKLDYTLKSQKEQLKINQAIKLSNAQALTRHTVPKLGEHTDEILNEWLGVEKH